MTLTPHRPPLLFVATAIAALAIASVSLPGRLSAEPVDWNSVPIVPFRSMQAIDANGYYTWTMPTDSDPNSSGHAYRLVGIVLNDPADMLDATADSGAATSGGMGGQWQVFIQRLDGSTDSGGAALWMGQNLQLRHGNDPAYSYTDAEWDAEMLRLNYPAFASGITDFSQLRAGDVIEVRARGGLFFAGKFNVNEQHWKDPIYDFDIVVLDRDRTADVTDLHLSTIKDAADQYYFSDDLTDTSNPEHYQSTLVRLHDVSLVDDAGWGSDGYVTVTDGQGRTFPLHLGLNGFDTVAPPAVGQLFDVVGIFNQEDPPWEGPLYDEHYELWVMDAGQFGATAAVPEPGAAVLVGTGLMVLWVLRRRRT